jgi:hypothetical protein
MLKSSNVEGFVFDAEIVASIKHALLQLSYFRVLELLSCVDVPRYFVHISWICFDVHILSNTSTIQGTQSDAAVEGVSEFPDMPCCDDCPCVTYSTALHRHPGYCTASFQDTPHEAAQDKGWYSHLCRT